MVWTSMQRVGLVAVVTLPLVGVTGGQLLRSSTVRVALSWVGAASALMVAVLVAAHGPAAISGGHGLGMVATPVSALLLLLVAGVGALVQSYSARYLQGSPRSDRFTVWAGVLVAAMALVAGSEYLTGLVLGWVAAGVAFSAAMNCRPDLPGVAVAVRAARGAMAVGDGCLVAAAAVIWWRAGDVRLGSPHYLIVVSGRLGAWRGVVAVLVVAAALARCGQWPFRRWLPSTVSAPTPTCAVLHAGVINGGGVLLVRLGPLVTWRPAMAALLVVAGSTAVWAGAVTSRQSDVKGQLAYSTMAQMGFMLAECAVGLYAAAVIHLVGHGLYKASLFFSSGSAVPRRGRPALPGGGRRLSGAAVAGLVAAAVTLPGLMAGDGPVLSILAVLTAAPLGAAFWAALPDGPWTGRRKWIVMLLLAGGVYGALVDVLAHFLASGVATAGSTLGQWWLAGIVAGAAVASQVAARSSWAPAVRAHLLDAGAAPLGWYGRSQPRLSGPGSVFAEPARALVMEVEAA